MLVQTLYFLKYGWAENFVRFYYHLNSLFRIPRFGLLATPSFRQEHFPNLPRSTLRDLRHISGFDFHYVSFDKLPLFLASFSCYRGLNRVPAAFFNVNQFQFKGNNYSWINYRFLSSFFPNTSYHDYQTG